MPRFSDNTIFATALLRVHFDSSSTFKHVPCTHAGCAMADTHRYASWVGGSWIPFYWTDNNEEAGMLPRRRAYVLPWQRGLEDGVLEAYIGVGYDDMHPSDVGLPISATDFVLGSEDYSVNLVQAMVADLAKVLLGGALLIDGKRYTTMQVQPIRSRGPHALASWLLCDLRCRGAYRRSSIQLRSLHTTSWQRFQRTPAITPSYISTMAHAYHTVAPQQMLERSSSRSSLPGTC